MRKVYLRSYGSMQNQEGSEKQTKLLNSVVLKCADELKAQGINVEVLNFGDKRTFEYDENTVLMYRSSLYRFYFSKKIKINQLIWRLKNKYYNLKSKIKR